MGFLENILGKKEKVRDKATQLGMSVQEVSRDLPKFNHANDFQNLVPGKCVRYALPRRSDSKAPWEMLQRDKKQGAQLPNGYLVKSNDINQHLLDTLRPIAEQLSQEYFEFEGTEIEVAAFWEEWGGAAGAEKIYKILSSLLDL